MGKFKQSQIDDYDDDTQDEGDVIYAELLAALRASVNHYGAEKVSEWLLSGLGKRHAGH